MIPTASCTMCKLVPCICCILNNNYNYNKLLFYYCRFAFDWLKKDFRAKFNNKPKLLFKYDGISKEARNIFKSLFSKHYISENPSETDIRCLEEVYTRNVSNTISTDTPLRSIIVIIYSYTDWPLSLYSSPPR